MNGGQIHFRSHIRGQTTQKYAHADARLAAVHLPLQQRPTQNLQAVDDFPVAGKPPKPLLTVCHPAPDQRAEGGTDGEADQSRDKQFPEHQVSSWHG